MRLRPALFAVLMAVGLACWFVVSAQQPPASLPIDSGQVIATANEISVRSEHLKPMLEELHPADWVAKGASDTYVSQLQSLLDQNAAIRNDMAGVVQHADAMPEVMKAIFRVQRFDRDLDLLLVAVRRYQNPALAELIESVAAGDQSGVERLQQYVLDLAGDKERQLDIVDKEAQRCRSSLAAQPVVRPAARPSQASPKANPKAPTK